MLTFNSPSALKIILKRQKLPSKSSNMAKSRWSTALTTLDVHISLQKCRFLMAKKAYVVRTSYFKSTETEKSERAVKRPVLIRTITSWEIGQRHSSTREISMSRECVLYYGVFDSSKKGLFFIYSRFCLTFTCGGGKLKGASSLVNEIPWLVNSCWLVDELWYCYAILFSLMTYSYYGIGNLYPILRVSRRPVQTGRRFEITTRPQHEQL